MEYVALALGLVLILEGLVYALAPSLVEQMLAALRELSLEARRLIGFFCIVIGLRYVTDLLDLCYSLTDHIASSQVERCNFMLGAFMKLALEGKDHTDRTLYHLLNVPTNDGGQWQMLVNLIEKYGVIPNEQWPSTWMANNSRRLGGILDNQVRQHSKSRPGYSAFR